MGSSSSVLRYLEEQGETKKTSLPSYVKDTFGFYTSTENSNHLHFTFEFSKVQRWILYFWLYTLAFGFFSRFGVLQSMS